MAQEYTALAGMEKRGYYANKLLSRIYVTNQTLIQPIDLELVKKAIYQLQLHHNVPKGGITKQAYTQPLAVALALMDYYLTTEALTTVLLYDMVLQGVLRQNQIEEEFGSAIANKINMLLSLRNTQPVGDISQIKKMIEQGDRDVLVITLLDNLYTMQNISTKPKWEQLETVLQSLKTFLPLAAYIRLPEIESELETICRAIILPELSGDKSASLSSGLSFAFLKF